MPRLTRRGTNAALLTVATLAPFALLGAPASADPRLVQTYESPGSYGEASYVAGERDDLPVEAWDSSSYLDDPDGGVDRTEDLTLPSPWKSVAAFEAGDQLRLDRDSDAARSDSYAIALSFRLTDADRSAFPGTRATVLTFDGAESGTGLVVRDGVPGWWHAESSSFTPVGGEIADGQWVSVAVSRGAGGTLRLDRAGASAAVPPAEASPSSFTTATIFGRGSTAGQLARVRVWDGPLSGAALTSATGTLVDTVAPWGLTVGPVPGLQPAAPPAWDPSRGLVQIGGEWWTGRSLGVWGTVEDDTTAPISVDWELRKGAGCAGAVTDDGSFEPDQYLSRSDAPGVLRTVYQGSGSLSGVEHGGAYTL